MFFYKQVKQGKITSVEAKSIDAISLGFVKATKAEYDTFIASLPEPEPPKPTRDLAHELDILKERVNLIEEGKIVA